MFFRSSVTWTIIFILCGPMVVIIRADRIYVSDQGSGQTSPIVHFLVFLYISIGGRSLLYVFRGSRLRIQIIVDRLSTMAIWILIVDVSSEGLLVLRAEGLAAQATLLYDFGGDAKQTPQRHFAHVRGGVNRLQGLLSGKYQGCRQDLLLSRLLLARDHHCWHLLMMVVVIWWWHFEGILVDTGGDFCGGFRLDAQHASRSVCWTLGHAIFLQLWSRSLGVNMLL